MKSTLKDTEEGTQKRDSEQQSKNNVSKEGKIVYESRYGYMDVMGCVSLSAARQKT